MPVFRWLLAIVVGCAGSLPVLASERCTAPLGVLTLAQGQVRLNTLDVVQQGAESALCSGDDIRVGRLSRALVRFTDGSVLPLDADARIRLNQAGADGALNVEVQFGRINLNAAPGSLIRLVTPHGSALSQAGELSIAVEPNGARLGLLGGTASVDTAEAGVLDVLAGEVVFFGAGFAPRKELQLGGWQQVRWVVQWPVILDTRGAELDDDMVQAYRQGRLIDALALIEAAPESVRRRLIHAQVLLGLGALDDARQEVSALLAVQPPLAPARALAALLALAADDTAGAARVADEGVQIDPACGPCLLARSYVSQAEGKLDVALRQARAAAERSPDNVAAVARTGELALAAGDLAAAELAGERALGMDPQNTLGLNLSGYVCMARDDWKGALARFEAALGQDAGDARARMGRGLALVALDDARRGRADLELAAALEPESSLVRSYLGRIFAAQGNEDAARSHYRRAMALDPNDPTPRAFMAGLMTGRNDPASALQHSLAAAQRAPARRVYRVESDVRDDAALRYAEAVASYRALGLDEQARSVSLRALDEAPSSWATHRARADSLVGDSRAEIERRSAVLQSLLREPLYAPMQRMEAAGMNRRDGLSAVQGGMSGGLEPAVTRLNEYAAVFDRTPSAFRFEGVRAGADTSTALAQARWVGGPLRVDVGYLDVRTDGFRPGQRQDSQSYELRARLQPSSRLQFLAEWRETHAGLSNRSYPYDTVLTTEIDIRQRLLSGRLGVRVDLGHDWEVLAAYSKDRDDQTQYGRSSDGFNALFPAFAYRNKQTWRPETEATEVQFGYTGGVFTLKAGGAHINRAIDAGIYTINAIPLNLFNEQALSYNTAYVFASVRLGRTLDVHAGASGAACRCDYLRSNPGDTRRYADHSPSVGLVWRPIDGGALRLASTAGMERPLASGATLEPNTFAGFRRLYSDMPNTVARINGLRWDHDTEAGLRYGAEAVARNLDITVARDIFGDTTWHERLQHVWAGGGLPRDWLPGWTLSLHGDLQHRVFDRHAELQLSNPESVRDVSQTELGVSAVALHRSGWGGRLRLTQLRQRGSAALLDPTIFTPVSSRTKESFGIVDLAVIHRLQGSSVELQLGARNLFDRKVGQYIEFDPLEQRHAPERQIFGRVSLGF